MVKQFFLNLVQSSRLSGNLYGYFVCLSGKVCRFRKQTEKAMSLYNRAITARPGLARIYYERGLLLKEQEKYADALEDLNKALLLNPGHFANSIFTNFFYQRGLLHKKLHSYPQAIIDFTRGIELFPAQYGYYYLRASTFFELKEYPQTLTDCDRAIKGNFKSAGVYQFRALANIQFGNYDEAIEDCNHGLAVKPDSYHIYVNRGYAYSRLQNYRQAIEDYNRALAYHSEPRQAALTLSNRGLAFLSLGELRAAFTDFKLSLEKDPTYLATTWNIVWLQLCFQPPDTALIRLLDGIGLNEPDKYSPSKNQRVVAWVARGVALGLKGKWDVASFELERAIREKSEMWDAHFWLGIARAYLEDTTAPASIERALALTMPPILLGPLNWLKKDRPETAGWVDRYLNQYSPTGLPSMPLDQNAAFAPSRS